jgi:hypothetical protein
MKKCRTTAAIALLVSTPLVAEPTPKRDILGFYPGMSYAQAMSVVANVCRGDRDMSSPEIPSFGFSFIFVKCSAGTRQEFFTTNPNLKQDREETLLLNFAADLPDQPLSSVRYNFVSRAPDQDLIQAIVDQFGISAVCEKTDSDSICFRGDRKIVTRLDPQGWDLSFDRRSDMPDALSLFDMRIVEAENAAGSERAKANKLAPTLGAKP